MIMATVKTTNDEGQKLAMAVKLSAAIANAKIRLRQQ